MIQDDVIYLFDLDDTPLRAFPDNVYWELEDLEKSTNRLTVYVPMSDSNGLKSDMDVYFRGRKFTIVDIEQSRNDRETIIQCDETQVQLADVNNPTFLLRGENLSVAMEKALRNSDWKVGTVFEVANDYFAQLRNISAIDSLKFLENQSGGKLVFDSAARTVSMAQRTEEFADVLLRYGRNVANITKNEMPPQATIIKPYGKNGMTIEALTEGNVEYIEDFSWYLSMGLSEEEARARYSKTFVWEDERYIYNANLFRDAQTKLSTMSQPQINYRLENPDFIDAKVGTYVYIADEELGFKVRVSVSRIKRCKNPLNDEMELDYIPPSFTSSADQFTGDSSGAASETAMFIIKNQSLVTITSVPSPVLTASISIYSATSFEMGLAALFEVTTAGLIEGYFMIAGERVATEFKQTVQVGWQTIGLPFIIPAVQEGTKTLQLYLKMTGGSAKIAKEQIELFVKAQGAYGGLSNDRPDQLVTENIEELYMDSLTVTDTAGVSIIQPLARNVSENVVLDDTHHTIIESVTVTLA